MMNVRFAARVVSDLQKVGFAEKTILSPFNRQLRQRTQAVLDHPLVRHALETTSDKIEISINPYWESYGSDAPLSFEFRVRAKNPTRTQKGVPEQAAYSVDIDTDFKNHTHPEYPGMIRDLFNFLTAVTEMDRSVREEENL
jgi:hypothetical protein